MDLTEEQEQDLIALYDMEWSVTELAKRFECPRTLVRRILCRCGLVVEVRQKARGFIPTPLEIEQGTTKFREARLKEKREHTGRLYNSSPAAIRVVKLTRDKDGMYLEPV